MLLDLVSSQTVCQPPQIVNKVIGGALHVHVADCSVVVGESLLSALRRAGAKCRREVLGDNQVRVFAERSSYEQIRVEGRHVPTLAEAAARCAQKNSKAM